MDHIAQAIAEREDKIAKINTKLARLGPATPATYRDQLAGEIATIEDDIDRLRVARTQDKQRKERERDEREKRAEEEAAAFEADLRSRFRTRVPAGSDADYQSLRPSLLAEVAEERKQQLDSGTKAALHRIQPDAVWIED